MKLVARPLDGWPGTPTPPHKREISRFSATWTDTVDLLTREVEYLAPHHVEVILQLAVSERDCRLDGWIRADANVKEPGVVLAFDSRVGPLRFSCDRFTGGYIDRNGKRTPAWQNNVRAIALGLEALRKVERYGLGRGVEQYTGWRQLGAGEPIALSAAMTVEEAARFIAEQSGAHRWADLVADPFYALDLFKDAAKIHHPDAGGDPDVFRKLVAARDLLQRAAR